MKNVKPGHTQPIICLDAGHYGKYNRSPAIPEYYESDMNWKLHLMLKSALERYGIKVKTTRANKEKDLSLNSRGAASEGCDLFISIHSNAAGSAVNESTDYVVVLVPLDGSGDEIGKMLADVISDVMDTKQKGRIAKREGNNGDYYGVIRAAVAVGTTGLLVEHSFHTNTRSTRWLMDDNNLKRLAEAEAAIIAEYYGMPEPGNKPDKGTLYRVQAGAYKVKSNADAQLRKMKSAGFDAIITSENGMYKIQSGAYGIKANAERQLSKLRAAGFDAFISK